jgi:predicted aconitase
MRLTPEEEAMLEGKKGYPAQKGMEILYQLGNIYDAEEMIKVENVHMPGSSVVVAGEAGTKFVEKMVENAGIFCASTTLNTSAIDFGCWEKLGFEPSTHVQQKRLTDAYCKMGALPCHTCTPYLIGSTPRVGEHVSWGESSAIAFANSVLGARTNREGGPSALAAALTGRVPAYGFHLQENRYGHFHVKVETQLNDLTDFGSLGYFIGKIVESKVPVFTGISSKASLDELKMLGAALASSGSVALFHVVGVTPEAPTLEAAFGGRAPQQVIEFGPAELAEARRRLDKNSGQEVSMVVLGCPHLSINELDAVARKLVGKKVKDGVRLWIMTAQPNQAYAERCGFARIIREAGGQLVSDTCPILAPMAEVRAKYPIASIATNSAKLAHYAPGQWALPTHYGNLDQCISAALTGRF